MVRDLTERYFVRLEYGQHRRQLPRVGLFGNYCQNVVIRKAKTSVDNIHVLRKWKGWCSTAQRSSKLSASDFDERFVAVINILNDFILNISYCCDDNNVKKPVVQCVPDK